MTRVLITGGAGFIGSHLARAFVARGDDVHVLIRSGADSRRLAEFADKLAIHEVALEDQTALDRCFASIAPEIIYHLAVQTRDFPQSPLDEAMLLIQSDLSNLIRVLTAASKANPAPRAFIRTGSLAENGAARAPYVENDRERPLTPYAAATVSGTHFLAALAPSLPFKAFNARLTLVYGPRQSTAFLIPSIIEACLSGKPVVIHNPDARRDLLYIDDLVEGLIALGEADFDHPEPINFCTGVAFSMKEAATAILEATGADKALVRFGDPNAARGAMNFVGSPALAERLLGWRARTPFDRGVRSVIRSARDDMERRRS